MPIKCNFFSAVSSDKSTEIMPLIKTDGGGREGV